MLAASHSTAFHHARGTRKGHQRKTWTPMFCQRRHLICAKSRPFPNDNVYQQLRWQTVSIEGFGANWFRGIRLIPAKQFPLTRSSIDQIFDEIDSTPGSRCGSGCFTPRLVDQNRGSVAKVFQSFRAACSIRQKFSTRRTEESENHVLSLSLFVFFFSFFLFCFFHFQSITPD